MIFYLNYFKLESIRERFFLQLSENTNNTKNETKIKKPMTIATINKFSFDL